MSANRIQTPSLPVLKLLALATAAFLTLLTEIMPAGLLSSIATGLDVSESLAGQFITAFALGALLSAIPATALTRGLRRKPLLLVAISGFAVVNAVTAVSDNYALSLAARFVAGLFGGVVWSMLAGYASRMVPRWLLGRAIAIVGAGSTAALVLGVPIGGLLGSAIGWQGAFGLVSVIAVLLAVWIALFAPDFPGESADKRLSLPQVAAKRGVGATLALILTYIVTHNILYIYIEPFLVASAMGDWLNGVLFIFGAGAVFGLVLSGIIVDGNLKRLGPAEVLLFAAATLLLGLWSDVQAILILAVFMWGISFGGFSVVTQTAMTHLSSDAVDVAQSMSTTSWNTAVASGGVIGGLLLSSAGPGAFPWVMIGLLTLSFLVVLLGVNRALTAAKPAQSVPVRSDSLMQSNQHL
ncbi:MFS transporter [Pectobacterium versatile]|uniref:MFS transporter n=1 Tax=Pectobacterium versatile TaxID=2488639 RepID=UPI000F650123|nr:MULTISPECIES: MFS transporter [Pectobacterium]AZK64362.1 MFS transporter [Pectobacterium versatile]MCL6388578.1 MFS transporter [Pectobacterium carotovorum subsp. carotovorum]